MFIDKEKEKAILSKFFIALCDAEVEMSKAINKEIDSVDTDYASVNKETANIINKFSKFINDFDDVLRDDLNIDTLELLDMVNDRSPLDLRL
jgi:hypothetical protein